MNKQTGSNAIEWWQSWSPELAYVLGFAFADGGIGQKSNILTIGQSNREILDQISEYAPFGEITYSTGAKVWRLKYRTAGFGRLLQNYGIVPNKTEFGFWPLHIPADMIRHYIRGFFDGDGHVRIYTRRTHCVAGVSFVCHLPQYLERLNIELLNLGASNRIILKDGNNYRLRYSRHSDLLVLYDIFYKDATLFLQRKRNTFDRVIEYIRATQGRKGSAHGNAKLTENDILQIRALKEQGKTLKEIGDVYQIGKSTVSLICRGEAWTHVK